MGVGPINVKQMAGTPVAKPIALTKAAEQQNKLESVRSKLKSHKSNKNSSKVSGTGSSYDSSDDSRESEESESESTIKDVATPMIATNMEQTPLTTKPKGASL